MTGLLQVGHILRNALRIDLKQEKEQIFFQKNWVCSVLSVPGPCLRYCRWKYARSFFRCSYLLCVTSCLILDEFCCLWKYLLCYHIHIFLPPNSPSTCRYVVIGYGHVHIIVSMPMPMRRYFSSYYYYYSRSPRPRVIRGPGPCPLLFVVVGL